MYRTAEYAEVVQRKRIHGTFFCCNVKPLNVKLHEAIVNRAKLHTC